MKYNININQLALNDMAPSMDIVEAAILDYLIIICKSVNEKIDNKRFIDKDGEVWTWVDFQTLLEEMPLLHLYSRSSLTPRIKKIEENGFISTFKKRINGHIRLFVKLNRKIEGLFIKMDREGGSLSSFTNDPVHTDEQDPQKPVRETGPIIYTNNNHYNYTRTMEKFGAFWDNYPKKKKQMKAISSWFKIDPSLFETIIEDVKKRKADREWLRGYIPDAVTYLNGQLWNDEIEPLREGDRVVKNKYIQTQTKFSNDKKVTIIK
jgi:hypothetical protein